MIAPGGRSRPDRPHRGRSGPVREGEAELGLVLTGSVDPEAAEVVLAGGPSPGPQLLIAGAAQM